MADTPRAFAKGGIITGPGGDDRVPLRLDSGYVIPAAMVREMTLNLPDEHVREADHGDPQQAEA